MTVFSLDDLGFIIGEERGGLGYMPSSLRLEKRLATRPGCVVEGGEAAMMWSEFGKGQCKNKRSLNRKLAQKGDKVGRGQDVPKFRRLYLG